MIAEEARRVLGTYDYDWTQLTDATQKDREQQGFPANEPLLRTGELKSSIGYTILSETEAEVGSNSDIAVFQELGTIRIPSRSFLAAAAAHKGHDAAKVAGKIIADAIMAAGRIFNVEQEIWRIAIDAAKELGRDLREAGDDLMSDQEQENRERRR